MLLSRTQVGRDWLIGAAPYSLPICSVPYIDAGRFKWASSVAKSASVMIESSLVSNALSRR